MRAIFAGQRSRGCEAGLGESLLCTSKILMRLVRAWAAGRAEGVADLGRSGKRGGRRLSLKRRETPLATAPEVRHARRRANRGLKEGERTEVEGGSAGLGPRAGSLSLSLSHTHTLARFLSYTHSFSPSLCVDRGRIRVGGARARTTERRNTKREHLHCSKTFT